jgi:aspartyl protease family protein
MPNGTDLVPPSRHCARNAHGMNVRAWQSGITVLAAAGLVVAACAHVLAADDREECATTGSLDRSIAACARVIANDAETAANRAAAYKNRGNAYYSRKDYDRAIADYNEAIRLDPSQTLTYHVLAYVNRGIAAFDRKDYDRAIADFSEAIRLDPKFAVAYNRRGLAYLNKRDLDRAFTDFNEAMNLNPNLSAAYNNRGIVYERRNDLDLAFADYSEAIRRDPNNAFPYRNRGLLYARRYDYAAAVADYGEAIKHNHPALAQVYSNRGLAYKALGLTEEAIADFRKAQAIDPSDQTSKAQLAVIPPGAAPAAATSAEILKQEPPVGAIVTGQTVLVDDGSCPAGQIKQVTARNQITGQPRQRKCVEYAGSTAREAATERGSGETVATAMSRLSIGLPANVVAIAAVRQPLDDLGREPCDRLAITKLGLALGNVGRRREAAAAQLSFSAACGGHVPSLKSATSILLDLSDYAGATAAASELIKLEPFDAGGYNLRALAYDRGGSPKKAIDDYLTTIEMFENRANMPSDIYFAVARNYERLGQFCDAVSSVETWVALNPASNTSSRTQAIIADYTAKGKCESPGSRAEEVFRFPPQKNVVRLPVTVNGVRGTFILDTGATFVSFSEAFAQKAKVQIDPDSKVRMHTANGIVDAKRGHATTVQLRSLLAKDVAVVVHDAVRGSFGDGVDGLLGMSFLSRFKVSIDTQAVRIANRNAK